MSKIRPISITKFGCYEDLYLVSDYDYQKFKKMVTENKSEDAMRFIWSKYQPITLKLCVSTGHSDYSFKYYSALKNKST